MVIDHDKIKLQQDENNKINAPHFEDDNLFEEQIQLNSQLSVEPENENLLQFYSQGSNQ